MKIRTKISLLLAGTVVLLTLGLVLVMTVMTATRFYDIEMGRARSDFARVETALASESARISAALNDYARWDDCWRFARGGFPDFPSINLTASTLSNLKIDFVAVYDEAGNRLFGSAIADSGELENWTFLPAKLDDPTSAVARVISASTGYLRTDRGAAMVESAEIVHSDQSGPHSGHLLMGKFMDSNFIAGISALTGVELALSLPVSSSEDTRMTTPAAAEAAFVADPSGKLIRGQRSFRSVTEEPAFSIGTATKRTLSDQARATQLALVLLAAALGLALMAMGRLVFQSWLARPLAELESALDSVNLVEENKTAAAFEPFVLRSDEIGHMAGVLALMNARMVEAHELVRKTNEGLEERIHARTADLESANSGLSLYRKILENTSEGIIVTDITGTIVECNEASSRISGFTRAQLIGKNPRIMKSGEHDGGFYAAMWRSILETGHWSGEISNRARDGTVYPKLMSVNTIRDAEGRAVNYIGISTDISDMKTVERRLHQLAYYDTLTGLPNRALFLDRLESALARARRRSSTVALVFLDLDRFKNVNDSFGHAVGDQLLVKFAARVKARLRETDTVCRLSGDEFTIILEDMKRAEDAVMLAQAILKSMADPVDIGGTEIYMSASLGIALFPKDGQDSASLLKKADAAMFLAKEEGRGTWRFASPDVDMEGRRRMETETKLHGALERGEFRLWYQPQTSAASTRPGSPDGLVGAEALIRWLPMDGVIVGPGAFIGIAEDTGLIVPIGEWVIREACLEARRWIDAGFPLQMSVNVSARQFDDGKLPGVVASALAETGLPPALLKLELTESLLMKNMARVIDAINAIREMGVTFAIDDFGTGYSSLQYLHEFPVDCLKIDRSFVMGLGEDRSKGDIVTAVISLAHAFGMMSIAEGVETEEQLAALKERGCDQIQGFLVSRPLSSEAFFDFARAAIPAV